MPIYENFPTKEPVVTVSQDGLMSKEDKAKLDAIEAGANKYVHPNDANTRHVSDQEKSQWSNNTVYTNSAPLVDDRLGLKKGETFDNVPISQLMTKMLYPYSAPQVSLTSDPNGGVYEIGASVKVNSLTAHVTKKSDNITKVEVFDGSVSLGSKTDGQTGNLVFPLASTNVTTNKRFTVKVTDASEKITTASSPEFTFVSPFFSGVVDPDSAITGDAVKLLTKSVQTRSNKVITYSPNNQKMLFAYPKSYGALKKIEDPNKFDVTSTWQATEVQVAGLDGNNVTYYVYVQVSPVTLDNYKMAFYF